MNTLEKYEKTKNILESLHFENVYNDELHDIFWIYDLDGIFDTLINTLLFD